MRAFDVLTKADYDIRGSTQPRYHLELALLRWIHLRRLVPLTDIIQGLDKGGASVPRAAAGGSGSSSERARRPEAGGEAAAVDRRHRARRRDEARRGAGRQGRGRAAATTAAGGAAAAAPAAPQRPRASALKDALVAEMQKTKKFFYGTVIAQAQRIDVEGDRVVLAFAPSTRAQAAARAEPAVARGDGLAPRRPQDARRRR